MFVKLFIVLSENCIFQLSTVFRGCSQFQETKQKTVQFPRPASCVRTSIIESSEYKVENHVCIPLSCGSDSTLLYDGPHKETRCDCLTGLTGLNLEALEDLKEQIKVRHQFQHAKTNMQTANISTKMFSTKNFQGLILGGISMLLEISSFQHIEG